MIQVSDLFDKHNDEYLNFERVENKRSKRPDLHAMLLLDEICPGPRDMVSAAEHDVIYLDVSPEALESATEEQIIELVRCGVHIDEETDSLAMFA